MPTSEIERSTTSFVASTLTPSAVSTSAEPAREETARLPCFATVTPAPATTNAAVVEMLKVFRPSPPVPQVSTKIWRSTWIRSTRARTLMHGKTSRIHHDGRGVFAGLAQDFEATRYHSLVVERRTLPAALEVTSWTAEGEIMGLRHRALDVEGVQFHPESILTSEGKKLLGNWLGRIARGRPS